MITMIYFRHLLTVLQIFSAIDFSIKRFEGFGIHFYLKNLFHDFIHSQRPFAVERGEGRSKISIYIYNSETFKARDNDTSMTSCEVEIT